MKRIFKQASMILTGLMALYAGADEGEMYSVSLNGKPQVLIILDTSAHMKEEADFPYPKYYDPHIAYPPTPDTNAEDIIYRWFYGGEQFYYNNSASAKALNHTELRDIAEKAVDTYAGGPALTGTEQEKYNAFVTTIPARGSGNKLDFSKMNCYSAVADFREISVLIKIMSLNGYQARLNYLMVLLGSHMSGVPLAVKRVLVENLLIVTKI